MTPWSTGMRNDTALPARSAWFATSATSLTAGTGYMLGTNLTSSRLWLTYFTANAASPVSLASGQTLKVTLTFTPTTVSTAPSSSTTMRIGLFDYADGGTRVAADTFSSSGANGANVQGYALFLNFTSTFTDNTPMRVFRRTNLSSTNLLGTTGDFTSVPTNAPTGMSGQSGL